MYASPSPHSGPSSSSSGGPWLWLRDGNSSIALAPQHRDEIAARVHAVVAERAVGRGPELKRVAGREIMRRGAFDKSEMPGEHPDDLRHEAVGGSRKRDGGAHGKLDLGHLHRN